MRHINLLGLGKTGLGPSGSGRSRLISPVIAVLGFALLHAGTLGDGSYLLNVELPQLGTLAGQVVHSVLSLRSPTQILSGLL